MNFIRFSLNVALTRQIRSYRQMRSYRDSATKKKMINQKGKQERWATIGRGQ